MLNVLQIYEAFYTTETTSTLGSTSATIKSYPCPIKLMYIKKKVEHFPSRLSGTLPGENPHWPLGTCWEVPLNSDSIFLRTQGPESLPAHLFTGRMLQTMKTSRNMTHILHYVPMTWPRPSNGQNFAHPRWNTDYRTLPNKNWSSGINTHHSKLQWISSHSKSFDQRDVYHASKSNPTDHHSTSKPSFASGKVGSKLASHQHWEKASATGTVKSPLVVQLLN